MIVEASAIVAVFRGEPEAEAMARAMETAHRPAISAATLLETSMVLGAARQDLLDELLDIAELEVIAVDEEQVRIARAAVAAYGRGSGSPARLNSGDCFSYALAKATQRPLLFTGDDFTHTDVERAWSPA